MRTRVIFNQKGGVGKSSITVNLAAISAHQKLKTLVIDLDPQANSSQYLLGDDATYSAAKTALEPNIENFFSDVLGTNQNKGLIGSALGSILKQRNKGGLTDYIHASPFPFLDVLPASPTLGRKSDLSTKSMVNDSYSINDPWYSSCNDSIVLF